MVSVDEALTMVLNECLAHSVTNRISIKETQKLVGSTLAQDVRCQVPLPPFPASIKDGYAVLAEDGIGLRNVCPTASTAGTSPHVLTIGRGNCVRINTGAPLPQGADAVVQVEDTAMVKCSEASHSLNFDVCQKQRSNLWPRLQAGEELQIEINTLPVVGQDIRKVGSDIAAGEVVLEKGVRLGAIELGLIAAVGQEQVEVIRQPIVGLLSTGDEVS